jgi:hypothetical protein
VVVLGLLEGPSAGPVVEAERGGGGFGAGGGVRTGRWLARDRTGGAGVEDAERSGWGRGGCLSSGNRSALGGRWGSGAALHGVGANRPRSLSGMESAAAELPGRQAPAAPDPGRARTRVVCAPLPENDAVVIAPLDVRALRAIRWPAVGKDAARARDEAEGVGEASARGSDRSGAAPPPLHRQPPPKRPTGAPRRARTLCRPFGSLRRRLRRRADEGLPRAFPRPGHRRRVHLSRSLAESRPRIARSKIRGVPVLSTFSECGDHGAGAGWPGSLVPLRAAQPSRPLSDHRRPSAAR